MDLISISTACSNLAFALARNGRALVTVFEKYQNSQHSIFMIQTECTVVAALLSQLESTIIRSQSSRLSTYPTAVVNALDVSLTSCATTLLVLNKEISDLTYAAGTIVPTIDKSEGSAYAWKEPAINELLQQLRSQSSALMLLLRAFDSSSNDHALRLVETSQTTFQTVQNGAASLRDAFPDEKYVENIWNMALNDSEKIYLLEPNIAEIPRPESWDNSNALVPAGGENPDAWRFTDVPLGWERCYAAEWNQWFYVNLETKISQWDHPGYLAAVTSISHSGGMPIDDASTWSANSAVAQSALQGTIPAFSSLTINENKIDDPTEDDNIDSTPWLLNSRPKFEKHLDGLLGEHEVPAAAVGVIFPNKAPELFVRGVRRNDLRIAVTANDKFNLAMNDTMTCALLAMLIDKGLLMWNAKLVDYLPASVARRVHSSHRNTTFSMFATSRSGISEEFWDAGEGDLKRYLSRSDTAPKQGRIAIALYFLARPPDKTPGTDPVWHQANAPLIALALEEATKQSFEVLIKTMLFNPLEMYSTGFGYPDMVNNTATNPIQPWGHDSDSKEPADMSPGGNFNRGACWPVHGIHCTAGDYAAFVQFQLRCAMGLDTNGMISADGMKAMFNDVGGGFDDVSARDWAKGGLTYSVRGNGHGMVISTIIAPTVGKAFFCIATMGDPRGTHVQDESILAAVGYARDK